MQNVALAFSVAFDFACKQQLIGHFLNSNGDLAFVFSVMLSSCALYFSVILPVLIQSRS